MSDHDRQSFEGIVDVHARRVFLQASLESEPVDVVVRALLYLDRCSSEPMELWLSTPGGPTDQMFALYDVMRSLRSPITTIGVGKVVSAGALLLAAGSSRIAGPNCELMVHAGEMGVTAFGPEQLALHAGRFQRYVERWAALMAAHTKCDAAWWREQIANGRDFYLDAAGMLAHGVIDRLLGVDFLAPTS